jgi:hypothetical protein
MSQVFLFVRLCVFLAQGISVTVAVSGLRTGSKGFSRLLRLWCKAQTRHFLCHARACSRCDRYHCQDRTCTDRHTSPHCYKHCASWFVSFFTTITCIRVHDENPACQGRCLLLGLLHPTLTEQHQLVTASSLKNYACRYAAKYAKEYAIKIL